MGNPWRKKSLESSSQNKHIDFIFLEDSLNTKYLEVKSGLEMIPEWYKKMPSTVKLKDSDTQDDLTIKKCMPVFDSLTAGYYLVTTNDYIFSYNKDNDSSSFSTVINDNISPITLHQMTQLPGVEISDEYIKHAYKWRNPYSIKTPSGYSVLFTQPMNRMDLPFTVLPGIVDTDKYFAPVQFPFFMKNNFSGVIPKGTPIVQVVPFKREDWKASVYDDLSSEVLKNHRTLAANYESNRHDKDGALLGNTYKRRYRSIKKYL